MGSEEPDEPPLEPEPAQPDTARATTQMSNAGTGAKRHLGRLDEADVAWDKEGSPAGAGRGVRVRVP